MSGIASEEASNLTFPYSPTEDEVEIGNCDSGSLSVVLRPKLNTGEAALVSFLEAILSPKLNLGGVTFDSFGKVTPSVVKDDLEFVTVGKTVTQGDVLWNMRFELFSAVIDPAEFPISFFWFISDPAGLIPVRTEALSSLTYSEAVLFLSAKAKFTFSLPSTNAANASPFGRLSSSKSRKSCKQYP